MRSNLKVRSEIARTESPPPEQHHCRQGNNYEQILALPKHAPQPWSGAFPGDGLSKPDSSVIIAAGKSWKLFFASGGAIFFQKPLCFIDISAGTIYHEFALRFCR